MVLYPTPSFISVFPSRWDLRRQGQFGQHRPAVDGCTAREWYSGRCNLGVQPVMAVASARRKSKSLSRKTRDENVETSNPVSLKRTGMNTAMVLSPEMQKFIGTDMETRPGLVRALCRYVKEKNLYAEGNRKRFVCDEAMKALLGTDGEHSLLNLHKLVTPHLMRASSCGRDYEERAEEMFQQYLRERGAVETLPGVKKKDPRGLNSAKAQKALYAKREGIYSDVVIDPSMHKICGGVKGMSRAEVLKAVWAYIKDHKLQDPANGRVIIVDKTLEDSLGVTGVKTLDSFQLPAFVWKKCGSQKRA